MRDHGGQDLDGQAPDRGTGGRFELLEPAGGWGRPVAVTVEDAAELLAEDLARVAAAAAVVEPYRHQDRSSRWSLRELERELGRRKRSGAGSAWRAAASARGSRGPRPSDDRGRRPGRRGGAARRQVPSGYRTAAPGGWLRSRPAPAPALPSLPAGDGAGRR